jgi:signal transduction histidine kinase
MRFPPPARYFAPLLVLVFGLAATWLDYELNLANDLARDLANLREQADATGARLAKLGSQLLPRDDTELLQSDLAASVDAPGLEGAAIVDGEGKVVAGSNAAWRGSSARQIPLARAAALTRQGRNGGALHAEDKAGFFGAYPIEPGDAWVLVAYDRSLAIAEAESDARGQLRWIASAVGLLCFSLWAALHFGFAERISRLARTVRGFGAGENGMIAPLRGGDEVAELSGAFAAMAARVRAHEVERAAMEREVLETGERERRRIGHELHDGLGQRLTAAALSANSLADALAANAPQDATRAAGIAGQLREAIAETRELSHGLAPAGLEAGGLVDALAELVGAVSRSGRVRGVLESAPSLPMSDPAVATHLFRIAQEAVTNALRHASANEIRVGLEAREGRVTLEVEDDGSGMPEPIPMGRGIGLRVMRHRAQLLGGALEIVASPAGGTLVRCRVPIAPHE